MDGASFVSNYIDDGKILTDRKYSKLAYDNSTVSEGWVKIKCPNKSFNISVVTDFGYEAIDVFNFYTRVSQCKGKGEYFPNNVAFYVSSDGKKYTFIGNGTTLTNTSKDKTTAIYSFVSEKGLNARYVKTVFGCSAGSILCLNEVAATAQGLCFDVNNGSQSTFKDSQGIIYTISQNKATITGFDNESRTSSGSVFPSSDSFNENSSVYYLGKGTDNEIKVTSDFIGIGRPNFSNAPNNIQYIIIHNTATTHESTTAERYNQRMHNTDDTTSWHYTVDENEIYHSLADSIAGWHAGPTHNYESIGIEICVNGAPDDANGNPIFSGSDYNKWVETRFKKSLQNTAVLVAELLTRYGLGIDSVIQHYDVTQKECPLWMRHSNGKFVYNGDLWQYFMDLVEHYYYLFNGDTPTYAIVKTSDIVLPDYLETQDGNIYPVTEIAPNVFVEIPNSVKSITLGKMINSIAQGSFDGNKQLDVLIADGNKAFSTDKNGRLLDSNKNIIFNPNETISKPSPKENSTLDIKRVNGKYYLISNSKTFTLNDIYSGYGCKITNAYDINGNKLDNNTKFGTGATIYFEDGAKIYTVLKGDVDGNAKIDANDYLMTKRIFLGTNRGLKGSNLAAAITNETTVEANDYILLKRYYFGIAKLF